jgi:hypothetical protein
MKRQKSCGPRLGKLVHQLPGVVTFAYDLRFRRVIAHWKGIIEEIHFGGSIIPSDIIEEIDPEKPSFRPSKWPQKLKLLKIVNCQNCQKTVLSQLEKVGGHRYPSGSTKYVPIMCQLIINYDSSTCTNIITIHLMYVPTHQLLVSTMYPTCTSTKIPHQYHHPIMICNSVIDPVYMITYLQTFLNFNNKRLAFSSKFSLVSHD